LEIPGKGRACRHHENETSKALAAKAKAEADAKEREAQRVQRKRERSRASYMDLKRTRHCYGCNADGFTKQEFATAMLIGMRKTELSPIEGESFFESIARSREAANILGVPVAHFAYDPNVAKVIRDEAHRFACEMVGMACLCKTCAESIGLDFDGTYNPPMKMTKETLILMSGVADAIKPDIDKLIEEERGDEVESD